MGTSFCHVVRIRHIGHEIIDITEGNQKWHGGIPNLVIKPINSNKFIRLVVIGIWGFIKKVIDPKRINPEPNAWAKKYFIEASASLYIFEDTKRGIKDIKLSSRPSQTNIHWELLIARIDPRISVEENKVVNGI